MSYRTIEITWRPRTTTEWNTFTTGRKETARLWGDLVGRHHRIRRLGWTWPSKARWQRWAKGRYPGISAQSAQQIIGEFCAAVDSCRQLRKNGQAEARYPWRKPHYHDVVYTNQDARIRDGRLVLPQGTSGTLRIRLPESVALPGRLMEVRLSFGVVRLTCEVSDAPHPQQTVIGVDLGVNTLIAATDGTKVFLVSGRGVKAVIQWRNKTLACLQQAQSSKTKGSLRWKRLQRRKYQMLDKTKRQVRDATHKATHAIAEAFPGATCFVGEPFNEAAQRIGRVQAQQVSTACTRRLIEQLDYKTAGAIAINEAYSSQTCPVCGERSKHRRIYRCPHCGATGPRDAIGAVNILSLGHHGAMLPGRSLPQQVTYLRPWRSSSGGHPARSSACTRREAPACRRGERHSQVLQDVLTRLDRAFQAFFRRVQAGEKPGYPRFKSSNRYNSFTYKQFGNGAMLVNGCLVLSKIGRIPVRWSRPLEGTPQDGHHSPGGGWVVRRVLVCGRAYQAAARHWPANRH